MNKDRNGRTQPKTIVRYALIGLALCMSIAMPRPVRGQLPENLTLEQAIDIATENHPLIHIHEAKLMVGEAGMKDAKKRFKPVLHIRTNFEPGYDNANGDDWGFGIGLSQELDRLFGANVLERSKARFEEERSREEVELVRWQVVEEVTAAYLDYTLAGSTLELRRRQLAGAEENLEKAKSTFEHADVTFEIIIRAQSELDDKQFEVLKAEKDFGRAEAALKNTLMLESGRHAEKAEPPASM